MRHTKRHRDNLEMALVMWTAVPPESVVRHLSVWACGSHACFGGHLAHWRHFIEQGVKVAAVSGSVGKVGNKMWDYYLLAGEPYMVSSRELTPGWHVSGNLFGVDLFQQRNDNLLDSKIVRELGSVSDHELVLRRIEYTLFGHLEH